MLLAFCAKRHKTGPGPAGASRPSLLASIPARQARRRISAGVAPLALLAWLAIPGGATAEVGSWTLAPGSEGARITAIAVDPVTPTTLYVAAEQRTAGQTTYFGLFKSVDGRANWVQSGLARKKITDLEIDPATPTTVYAGTSRFAGASGVFKSTDAGQSWSAANDGLTSLLVSTLIIDPLTPSTLYLNTGDGIFKSTDGAATWIGIGFGLPGGGTIVEIDPLTPTTIYSSWFSSQDGFFKSRDGGNSWALVSTTNTRGPVLIDPITPTTMYSRIEGISKSTDGRMTWNTVNAGLPLVPVFPAGSRVVGIFDIVFDPTDPATIYAAAEFDGVFKSTDSGGSWTAVNNGMGSARAVPVEVLAVHPQDPATLYAGMTYAGVFKSTNAASSWGPVNTGLPKLAVTAVAVDPVTPTTLYVGTPAGPLKSVDGGTNWSWIADGFTEAGIRELGVDPFDPDTVYLGTSCPCASWFVGLFKTTNGGATWSPRHSSPRSNFNFDPTAPGTLWAGTSKTTDGGASWTSKATPKGPGIVDLDPFDSETLYAATTLDGVYKTTTGGDFWFEASQGLIDFQLASLAADPFNVDTVYLGTRHKGVFKTVDGGRNWAASNIGASFFEMRELVVDPTSPGTVYAAAALLDSSNKLIAAQGVWGSSNGGARWRNVNQGLGDLDVLALAIAAANRPTLYAGTRSGLFMVTDPEPGPGAPPPPPPPPPQPSFDGDGLTDVTVYRQSTGEWYIRRSTDGELWRVAWGSAFHHDSPVPADYDGDGKADIAIARQGSDLRSGYWIWIIRSSIGNPLLGRSLVASVAQDVPVPGDYNGADIADIAIYRPTTGEWFVNYTGQGGTFTFLWGSPAHQDAAAPADYDGDRIIDIAIYRQSTGEWFIRRSTDGQLLLIAWGSPAHQDTPVPADYDGDLIADIAVYRQSTGEWFIRRSTDGQLLLIAWGSPALGDLPAVP